MTIYVRFKPIDGEPTLVAIPEPGRDPFEILAEVHRKMFPNNAGEGGTGCADLVSATPLSPAPVSAPQANPATAYSPKADSVAEVSARPARAGIRDSSMIAYRSLEWSGRLSKQQRLVMELFAANPHRDYTRQELANALSLGVNVICGRVNELLKPPIALLDEGGGRRECRITGEQANALRLAPVQRDLLAA